MLLRGGSRKSVQRGANPGDPACHLVPGVKEGNSKFDVFAPGRGEDIADQRFKRILSGHRRSRKSDDKLSLTVDVLYLDQRRAVAVQTHQFDLLAKAV